MSKTINRGLKTDAENKLERRKEHLAEAIVQGHFQAATEIMMSIAECEGQLEVIENMQQIEYHYSEVDEDSNKRAMMIQAMQKRLIEILANGADDQWSGSGNERQRALHRGRCQVAQDLMWDLNDAMQQELANL